MDRPFLIDDRAVNKMVTATFLSCVLIISIGLHFNCVKADSKDLIVFSGGITLYSLLIQRIIQVT